MSPKVAHRIRLIYGIVMSCLILLAGGALIIACLTIFNSPEGTFSRETISRAFGRIAVLVWLAVAGVVCGMVLSFALPWEAKRSKPERDEKTALDKMTAGFDFSALSPEDTAALERERVLRRRLAWITAGISTVLAIPVIVWILLPNSFGVGDKNREVLHAAAILAATAADVMITCFITGLLTAMSIRRERSIRKRAIIARTAVKRAEPVARKKSPLENPTVLWSVRGGIIAVAILFIVLGVFNGGMHDVLGKAIRICTECIGLG